jgi:Raf kinase inhibitor-like YbhB/YbcL family protein
MKKIIIILIILIILGGGFFFWQSKREITPPKDLRTISNMEIKSPVFENNTRFPSKYTCDGEGINPPLLISGVSPETQSLVLIFDDPDAPAGIFTHWTVWNIDPKTKEIKENNVPEGANEGMTDFGRSGYDGPCPPSGLHRYAFRLYSLDKKLDLGAGARRAALEEAMNGHVLEEAKLIAPYLRGE